MSLLIQEVQVEWVTACDVPVPRRIPSEPVHNDRVARLRGSQMDQSRIAILRGSVQRYSVLRGPVGCGDSYFLECACEP